MSERVQRIDDEIEVLEAQLEVLRKQKQREEDRLRMYMKYMTNVDASFHLESKEDE